jgi:hypothetical protein
VTGMVLAAVSVRRLRPGTEHAPEPLLAPIGDVEWAEVDEHRDQRRPQRSPGRS